MIAYYVIRKGLVFAIALFQAGVFACRWDESCFRTVSLSVAVILLMKVNNPGIPPKFVDI